MRSTSTSSGSTQGQSTSTLSWMPNIAGVIPSNRPLSAHSRNSEASSLGKATGKFSQQQLLKYQQQQQSQELENDDYYLEPISKKGQQQPSIVIASPSAPPPTPPSFPQPKIPDEK
uniref:Uncharacterized protein n=1 Tax=Meloidogyne incognita TaxID=6306 RepID=A0A914P1U5_MELIC